EQVAYFHGCYVNYNYPQLGKDLVKVLNALGVGVQLLDQEKCCGIALITNGMTRQALRHATHNTAQLRKAALERGLRIVSTSSSCTMTLREEYPNLLGVDNADIRDFLTMATRFIYEKLEKGATLRFRPDYHKHVAYHTPCHLERLGWGIFSERLLRMIPGVEFTLLDSACCGIAGTYGFKKENYAASQAIGQALFDQIRSVNPEVVACDCETCKWQIEMSAGYPVMNPISILAEAIE
nr:anaerobic glycerol-3-phosphate dehydrogenase subunit C [Bacteroidales bacterium]